MITVLRSLRLQAGRVLPPGWQIEGRSYVHSSGAYVFAGGRTDDRVVWYAKPAGYNGSRLPVEFTQREVAMAVALGYTFTRSRAGSWHAMRPGLVGARLYPTAEAAARDALSRAP